MFDACLVERVSAQKLRPWRCRAALLLVVFHEPLPELDCFARIVARSRHVDQPDMIRFRFLSTAVG